VRRVQGAVGLWGSVCVWGGGMVCSAGGSHCGARVVGEGGGAGMWELATVGWWRGGRCVCGGVGRGCREEPQEGQALAAAGDSLDIEW
jgi:hypothetical protein